MITHAPCWPTLLEQVKLADASPVVVQTYADDGFAITAETILNAVTPATRAIIINSPCNPTGALMTEEELNQLIDGIAGSRIYVILDLCYEQLIYEPIPHNLPKLLATRLRDRAILCGSASKSYAMTGWRCGWALGPGGGDRRRQRAAEPLDLERLLDFAEGDGRGAPGAGRHGQGRCSPSIAVAAISCTPG